MLYPAELPARSGCFSMTRRRYPGPDHQSCSLDAAGSRGQNLGRRVDTRQPPSLPEGRGLLA